MSIGFIKRDICEEKGDIKAGHDDVTGIKVKT
jgi:hypothetical protein